MDLKLVAGTPNDENRDYVPLAIKGSDMTVNENGNNSQVYPERLQEFSGEVAEGLSGVWYEYVPESYDGSKKVPLVVSNHGGLMTGWAQAVYSSWTLVAEKEGFIVVFPNAHEFQMWNLQGMGSHIKKNPNLTLPVPMDPEDYHDNYDMNFVKALIEKMKEKYNIDEERIFMQGMSMGHGMTDQFARYYGYLLAGAAGSAGNSLGEKHYDESEDHGRWEGQVPVWVAHPERNEGDPAETKGENAVKLMHDYWVRVNGVEGLPKISILGEDNFAFFTGTKSDFTFHDIKNRDHGQALDEAFYYWNYMFSGMRRKADGTIEKSETILPRKGDDFAFAVTPGQKRAWFKNAVVEMPVAPLMWQKLKYHGLEGATALRGEYMCVSLRFLAEVFGAKYETLNDGAEAVLTLKDGRVVKFARGVIGCLIDNNMVAMYCETLQREGELLVSAEWFARFLFNMNVSVCNGVSYVTDHFAELSTSMAAVLKDILENN